MWYNAGENDTVLHLPASLLQQPFNGLFSRTTWVSRYQKGKTNLDFTGARDSEWQWLQLGHMQVCTSLQTDNHANTPPLVFYRPDALLAAQPTASKHWRHNLPASLCLKNAVTWKQKWLESRKTTCSWLLHSRAIAYRKCEKCQENPIASQSSW